MESESGNSIVSFQLQFVCFLFKFLHEHFRDGLAMRKPMFEDDLMDDGDWEELVRKLDKFYTGKEGKAEMDRVCLQFDLHNLTDGNEELEPMCSVISYPIVNSKSR